MSIILSNLFVKRLDKNKHLEKDKNKHLEKDKNKHLEKDKNENFTIKSKKAQLKIQQMIFMVLAISLFFLMAGLFFISVSIANLEKDAVELQRDKVARLISKISSNPEFVFEGRVNSIDADKLLILKNQNKYRDFFGVDGIIIEKLYPVSEEERGVECTKFTYPVCDKIKLFTDSESATTSSFVSWCTKNTLGGAAYDKCSVGILMIEERKIE